MAQIGELAKFKVPLGGQEIELQQIDHVEGRDEFVAHPYP